MYDFVAETAGRGKKEVSWDTLSSAFDGNRTYESRESYRGCMKSNLYHHMRLIRLEGAYGNSSEMRFRNSNQSKTGNRVFQIPAL